MNRQIRAQGLNGEQVLHAEEIDKDNWRAVDLQRNAGICTYAHESLITRIADLIGEGYIYQLAVLGNLPIQIDRAGNTWLDHEYLAPHQYLPKLIVRHADLVGQ